MTAVNRAGQESEAEFLKNYKTDKYPKPSVTADIAVFSVFEEAAANYRKIPTRNLKILLIKRGRHPFKDMYALPGGFANPGESVDQTACRELQEETSIDCGYLEQVRVFSEPGRDPRGWVVTSAYLALLNPMCCQAKARDDASAAEWFRISTNRLDEERFQIELVHGQTHIRVLLGERRDVMRVTPELYVIESEGLAFDHGLIIAYALRQLRKGMRESRVGFALMPERFTMTQLQQTYEAVLGETLITAAFRRRMEQYVEDTEDMTSNGGHRPSRLFRIKNKFLL